MERRPSNSTGIPTTSMPSRRKWREQSTTVKSAIPNIPPVKQSESTQKIPPTPPSSLPVPTIPSSLPQTMNQGQVDIQSLLSGQLSAETQRAYRGDLKHFLLFIKHPEALDDIASLPKILSSVTRQVATDYRDYMMVEEKRAAATVNRRLATINTVFNALCEEGIIAKNPFSWVKRPKVGNIGKTPAFTQEQAENIISQPDVSTPLGRRDRIILLLLFFCGLRRSEVVKVGKDDFYQDQGHTLLKVHGKGRSDKSDTVMIPEQIWPEIQDYIKDKDGLIFVAMSRNTNLNRTDRPISANRVYLLFKEYCRKAGIDADAYSPHSTRATFITLCLSGGADVRSVMYASRHSDPSTTIRYDRQRMDIENHASQYLTLKSNPNPSDNSK